MPGTGFGEESPEGAQIGAYRPGRIEADESERERRSLGGVSRDLEEFLVAGGA